MFKSFDNIESVFKGGESPLQKKYFQKLFCLSSFSISLLFLGGNFFVIAGGIDIDRLKQLKAQNSPAFKNVAKAVLEAAEYSTARPIQRSKLPGPYRFYLEAGASATDIKDQSIALVSKPDGNGDRFAPDGYESFFGKAGVGLPYGFVVEAGTSYVFKEHKIGSLFGNIAIQAFDFDRYIVTDMIPAIALGTSFNWSYTGPRILTTGGTLVAGAYHRFLFAQISYILQFSYSMLRTPNYNSIFIRHGISSYWPLFEGLYVSTEIYYKPVQVGLVAGYQF